MSDIAAVATENDTRYFLKRLVTYGMFLLTWPFSLASLAEWKLLGREGIYDFWAKFFSLVPGRIGQYVRTSFYMVMLRQCHYDLVVGFGSFFSHPGATAGRGVVIGAYSIVGTVDLGSEVLVASRVSILSGKYQHGSAIRGDEGGRSGTSPHFERISIGSGTWIGEAAVVMANVGAGSVVSAGSVVTKPAPEETVAVGNPARFIKIREFKNVQQ